MLIFSSRKDKEKSTNGTERQASTTRPNISENKIWGFKFPEPNSVGDKNMKLEQCLLPIG